MKLRVREQFKARRTFRHLLVRQAAACTLAPSRNKFLWTLLEHRHRAKQRHLALHQKPLLDAIFCALSTLYKFCGAGRRAG